MTYTGKLPRYSYVHLSFLLIIDRYIERRIIKYPIDVRNLS